jgi:competence protein ComEC
MRRRIPVADAESIGSFTLGEVAVEVFGSEHRYRRAWENNSSVLVRLGHGERRALLTGDIEREAERVLVEQVPDLLPAEILKVPHHGSRSSTTPRFVAAVGPRIAVVSAGVRNRFGHPHAETEETLASARARIERTPAGGSITVSLSRGRVFVRREFDSRRP